MRRYRYKRRPRRYRRRYRRRFVRGRRRGYRKRLNQNNIYRFSRTYTKPAISSATSGFRSQGYEFHLSELSQAGTFTGLFDFYRIDGILIKFIPRQTVNTDGAYSGEFYIAPDYDDDNAFGNEDEAKRKQGVRVVYSVRNRPIKMFIRPRASMLVYNGIVTTSAYSQARRGIWIDSTNAGVPHYGVKWGWTQSSTVHTMDIFVTMYFSCKGVQ